MTRWRVTALIAALLLLPLAGCQARAGTAAFVGSDRITDDQVRQVAQQGLAVKAIAQTVGSDIGGYRQRVLGRLVKHALIAGAARQLGVSANDGQIDQAISANAQRLSGQAQLEAALAADPYRLPPDQLRPFFRDVVLTDAIGARLAASRPITDAEAQKFYTDNGGAQSGQTFAQLKAQVLAVIRQQRAQDYVKQYLKSHPVTVNPRYGRFDPAKLFDRNEASPIVAAHDDLVGSSSAKT